MIMSSTIALALSMAAAFALSSVDEFVHPKAPLSPAQRRAPSPKVVNGTVFESGACLLEKDQTLVLPDNTVVERHDGPTVRFFLSKTQQCGGQPPVSMHYDKSRNQFGIAQRVEKGAVLISTYGEWSNRGGSATIRLLVLIPRNVTYKLEEGLHGKGSQASSAFDPGDKALEECYWYAGPRPGEGWTAIATDLHYNRFLKPS